MRQYGPELLEHVEQVRGMARGLRRSDEDSTALAGLLAGMDVANAELLARAFTVYFHLANTVEQVQRGRRRYAKHRLNADNGLAVDAGRSTVARCTICRQVAV